MTLKVICIIPRILYFCVIFSIFELIFVLYDKADVINHFRIFFPFASLLRLNLVFNFVAIHALVNYSHFILLLKIILPEVYRSIIYGNR